MFKRIMFIVVIAAITTLMAAGATAQVWNFDKNHSYIGFTAKHMVITTVPGKFEDYTGQINFDGKDFTTGSAEVTIQAASINTDSEKRDNHLRSSDFFDVAKYPTITFKSTKIERTEGNNFNMTGDLTIKGITKPVTLACTLNGLITDPYGNTRAGFTATGMIKRHDFDIAWDNKLKDGSFIVGENINIILQVELVEQQEAD